MKRILLIFLFSSFVISITKAQEIPSTIFIGSLQGSSYYHHEEGLIWSEAQAFAEQYNGNLVSINTQEENDFIASKISSEVWLGLSDSNQEGVWEWSDGSEYSFLNWINGEPNNAGAGSSCRPLGEDFALMTSSGKWNDGPEYYCGQRAELSFIIEITNSSPTNGGDILLNGTVSAENNQIKNLADPTDAQDAVTLSLLQTKLNELIERIEVLESNANYDCGLAYFEDFSSCDLNGYYAQGGNITSTNSSFDGCGVYMTHYAGQDSNNFYAADKKFLYGVYELEAIADNGISDNIVYVLQQEELTGGYTFSFRPTGTDNPGWSVYNDGELVVNAETFPVARGNWYNVKIEVLKSSLKIWINDVVLFETDSITPPSDIPGYFKVGVAYSGGFDNLKFTPDSSVCE